MKLPDLRAIVDEMRALGITSLRTKDLSIDLGPAIAAAAKKDDAPPPPPDPMLSVEEDPATYNAGVPTFERVAWQPLGGAPPPPSTPEQ